MPEPVLLPGAGPISELRRLHVASRPTSSGVAGRSASAGCRSRRCNSVTGSADRCCAKPSDSSSITRSRACVAARTAGCWSASLTRPRPRTPSSSIWNTWAPRSATCWMRGCCWNLWRHRVRRSRSTKPASTGSAVCLRAEQDRNPDPAAPSDEFHAALAEQSKNPVLQLFIDILMRLTVRYAEDSRLDSASDALEAIDHRHRDHSAIVAAVTAGDAARAMTLSERHAESVTRWLQDHHHPGSRPRTRRGTDRRSADRASSPKCWPLPSATTLPAAVGRWGRSSEREVALLERYRVSRAVLREAVRLLEYHAVATTRRGPGGGLVVAEPQAQASIDTIALYLQYRQPRREDLTLIRDAIEIDNVAKVVRRRDAPEVRAFLDRHRSMIEEAGDDPRKAGVEEFLFHTGLATLAGNAVLELFLRILVEVFRRLLGKHRPADPEPKRSRRRTTRSPADHRGDRAGRRQPGPSPHPASPGRRRVLVAVRLRYRPSRRRQSLADVIRSRAAMVLPFLRL